MSASQFVHTPAVPLFGLRHASPAQLPLGTHTSELSAMRQPHRGAKEGAAATAIKSVEKNHARAARRIFKDLRN